MQRSIDNLCSHYSTYLVILCRSVYGSVLGIGLARGGLFFKCPQLLLELVPFIFLDLIMMLQREQRHGTSTSDLFPFKLL